MRRLRTITPRFCETDLLQQLRHSGQRLPDESLVLGAQALEGATAHTFRLAARSVQDARLPTQACLDSARASQRLIIGGFALAGIGQAVAVLYLNP